MLQGFGQDSFPDFEATGHARKIGTYFQRTFHSDAVSGLELKDDYQNPSSSKIIHRRMRIREIETYHQKVLVGGRGSEK